MRGLEQLIAEAPLFAGLPPADLELIAGCGRNQHAQAGTLLFREGEPAATFYLIRRGTVALEITAPGRSPLVIQTLHEHEVVGWSWLFAPYRWQMDARAITECGLVMFDGACLRGKCETDHELGYELMRRFAANLVDRLQATRLQLLDVYGHAPAPA
ncbi:MAG TPA: cyclic nucleotide-binding domain-containing protein [Solirubrobacteraceae bacterium]|nr:cyclic nucleotide-binding domain-containing protein [Solirubrobacteraceae bacterium]